MPTLTATQVIQRPVAQVFAVVANAGEFHRWNPTITSARSLSEGPPGLGSRFEWTLRGFGNVVQEFGEFEKDRRIRIVPHLKGMTGGHRFTFTDQGGATRIDHELVMEPQGLMKLMGPMLGMTGRKNLKETMAALQKRLEIG